MDAKIAHAHLKEFQRCVFSQVIWVDEFRKTHDAQQTWEALQENSKKWCDENLEREPINYEEDIARWIFFASIEFCESLYMMGAWVGDE